MNRFLLFLLLSIVAPVAPAALIHATVVSVHDGDTVTLSTGDKIRLSGIDAPEIKQPFGIVSREALRAAILNRRVTVSWKKMDRYKRKVGKIYLNRIDQNWRMIATGLAWHYKAYEREQSVRDRTRYAKAEAEARAARVGLWGDSAPIAPWAWRHALLPNSTVSYCFYLPTTALFCHS